MPFDLQFQSFLNFKSAYTTDMATRSGRRVKDFSESELSQ